MCQICVFLQQMLPSPRPRLLEGNSLIPGFITQIVCLPRHWSPLHSVSVTLGKRPGNLSVTIWKTLVTALSTTDFCKWECEVGTDTLFPFDVAKKCDEIHITRKLGRPSFHPYKSGGSRKSVPNRRTANRRSFFQRADPRSLRPFLGQTASQGRGMHNRTSK